MKRDRLGRQRLEYPADYRQFTLEGVRFVRITDLLARGQYTAFARSGRAFLVEGGHSKRFPWRILAAEPPRVSLHDRGESWPYLTWPGFSSLEDCAVCISSVDQFNYSKGEPVGETPKRPAGDDPAFYPGKQPGGSRVPNVRPADVQPGDPRLGVPADKMGSYCIPLATDKRASVVMMLFPPEELRDAPLDVIRRVVNQSGAGMLETIALEIYKAFTSDPVDAAAARTLSESLGQYADAMRSRG